VTLTPPSGGTFKTPQCAVATQYGPGNNSCFVQVALAPLAAGTASAQLLMQTEQAVSSGSASYSATITGYSYSAATGILTLTATNGFLPYELVKFSVSPPSGVSSPLAALANSSFSVLGNGLSANQFEIVTNAITGSGTQSSSNQFYTTATGVYTYTTVASTTLHGTGLGANVAVTPSLETTIGSGLKNPGEMAMDAAGNLYVADAGLGKVIEFAAGSSIPTAVGSGFTAPTGVAVNGDGDVFVADSGNVYEVPLWSAAAPTKLLSGLGTKLSLAVDGTNTLYIADPDNARVIRLWNLGVSGTGLLAQSEVLLTSGFTAPSLVAVDSSNNLYVVDGANLIEVSPSGTSTLLSNLSKVTGLAVDASGAVYLTATGGTSRIPSVSGALNASAATAIASTVTKPGGVALDRLGNVYLSDATALNVHEVETTGTLNFGTLPTPTSNKTLPATLTNAGNAALTVTGYSASKAPGGSTSYFPAETDYYPTDVNCETSSVAVGGNCTMDIEFNPGPGDQGTLTSVVSIADNATNGTVGIDNTGVGAPLASSVVSFTVGSSSEVVNTTVNVTVKASSGSAVPTGEVTVYYQSPTTTLDATHNPTNQTLTQTLVLSNGAATFTLAPVAAGSPSFTVSYQGDRVFGKATLTATGTVAKSNVKGMTLPAANTIPFYVQETTDSSTPYDGSQDPWTYALAATVTAKAGTPTGILEFLDSGSVACPATSGAGTPYLNTAGSADLDVGCLPMATGLTYVPYTSSHTITLAYQGDLNYNSYTYPGSFTMIAVRSSGVLVTAVGGTATTVSSSDGSVSASSALTVKAGSSASATLTLTSILGYGIQGNNQQLNNYTFPLSLSCDNLPPHSICTFSYPTPDPNIASAFDILNCNKTGSAPALPNPYQITGRNCSTGTVVVTINTNVAVGTTTSQNSPAMPLKSGALLLAGLLGLFFSRKLRQGWRTLTMGFACLLFLGSALLATTACATANLSPAAILSTPAGTYNVIITAQQVGTLTVTGSGAATVITGSQNQDSITFTLPVTVQ